MQSSKWLAPSASFIFHAGSLWREFSPLKIITKGFAAKIISNFNFCWGQLHHHSFKRTCNSVANFSVIASVTCRFRDAQRVFEKVETLKWRNECSHVEEMFNIAFVIVFRLSVCLRFQFVDVFHCFVYARFGVKVQRSLL